jgi:protein O-GlcNAc transferase
MANKIKPKRPANRQKKGKPSAGHPGLPSGSILQQAMAHHQAGRLTQAESLYWQILLAEPDNPIAHYHLGNVLLDQGRFEDAAACYRQALALNPDLAEAHGNLGNIFKGQGKLVAAVASYRRALVLKPDLFVIHYNLGNVLSEQGKLEEAAASYRKMLELRPDFARAHLNLGVTFHDQGKLDEAFACFRQALALQPDFVEAHCNLGKTLHDQGRLNEAIASFLRALSLHPDFAEAHCHLGVSLQEIGKLDEALASYRRALALKPDFVDAHNNLGIALHVQGKLDGAAASFRRALVLQPDLADAYSNLGNVLKDQGRIDEAVASYRQALILKPDFFSAHSNLLLCLNYLAGTSVSSYLEEARLFGQQTAARVGERFSHWTCAAAPERLRLGLVSGDFRNHPVGFFLENILAELDPARIELFAYSTNHQTDALTARIRSRFGAWKSLLGLPDEAAARLIHDDGVHVLLDLSGHTSYNRLPVFAWKPAPVQVSWLGYSASTGLAEMDYLLADPYVVPPSEEKHFSEAIWRLPESYLCFSPPRRAVEVAPLPALEEGCVTFGSFNNPAKINDLVIALWAKVMHAVKGSRLFLKAKQFGDATFSENMRQRFLACGIGPGRLIMEGFDLNREDHLTAYNRVDIALDTFPYNGTTTSVEGLWMGVPFITRRGDRFIAHVGESIAQNVGMTDWIAGDDEDYLAKVVAHSADLEQLSRLRAGLRQQALASPLFDSRRFARNFETAMWGMWRCFSFARHNEVNQGGNQ